jgi:hypothetical protein
MTNLEVLPVDQLIYTIRGHRVMLDRDLARIYGVSTARLNQQVNRNKARFPDDFMFQLTKKEAASLRLQIATLDTGRGRYSKYLPHAFTEHGAVMLASVLNSDTAITASIQIVRAFNRLRRALSQKNLALALTELARRVAGHDHKFEIVFNAINELMEPPAQPRKRIGFTPQ